MISEDKLGLAEVAIEKLAEALSMSESDVVRILREGMENISPIYGQLGKTHQYFIDEMEATFC